MIELKYREKIYINFSLIRNWLIIPNILSLCLFCCKIWSSLKMFSNNHKILCKILPAWVISPTSETCYQRDWFFSFFLFFCVFWYQQEWNLVQLKIKIEQKERKDESNGSVCTYICQASLAFTWHPYDALASFLLDFGW